MNNFVHFTEREMGEKAEKWRVKEKNRDFSNENLPVS